MTATYRSNNIAADIKRIIPARIAAERYGFTPNRAGYICCPFHMEKTGSLKFFNDGGWHCFGCGKGGSSIDFVMELFDIDFRQAVLRLDMDFSLNLIGEKPARAAPSAILEQRRKQQLRRRELETEIQNLCREHLRLEKQPTNKWPDFSTEDFKNGRVFEWLESIPSNYQRTQAEYDMRDRAKELKITGFPQRLKAYRQELKKVGRMVLRDNGFSEFAEQELDLNVGE